MEYLIAIIASLVGGFFYLNSKKKSAEADALVANVRGQDKQLQIKGNELKLEIGVIDARIEEIKKIREQQAKIQNQLTLVERAEKSSNKFGDKK